MRRFLLLVFLAAIVSGEAQDLSSINKKLGFHDACYDARLKSIKLYKSGNPLSDPVVSLKDNETVTLMFDEVNTYGESPRDYYYTVEHRDADWATENLIQSEYVTGYAENRINSTGSSMNTGVSYINYSLILPNNDIRLKISGNYVIRVYDNDSRTLLFEKGFSMVEPGATVYASIDPPVSQPCMQQMSLKVAHQNLRINDAYANLKIRVEQNSSRLPGTINPTPVFSQPNLTDYSRPDKNIFPGLNEFRSFDIRNLTYNGQGVAHIRLIQGTYRVNLVSDVTREKSQYMNTTDINGKYIIGSERAHNPATQSDYVDVAFTLSAPEPLIGRVFLFGELTGWSLQDEYEMLYDHQTNTYTNSFPFKQGYYNYRYVLLTHDGNLEIIPVEGCFYDTENSYGVYVYMRSPGTMYDRLVGFEKISSRGK